jgi:hypothetical protein
MLNIRARHILQGLLVIISLVAHPTKMEKCCGDTYYTGMNYIQNKHKTES